MTDTALPDTGLTPYQGNRIIGTSIALTNAGDGLSEKLAIDPVEYPVGTELTVAVRVVVDNHSHKRVVVKGQAIPGVLHLVQTLKASMATIVDAHLVDAALEETEAQITAERERRKLEAERAKGVQRVGDWVNPPEGATEDDLKAAHAEGEHDAAAVIGCSTCEAVAAAGRDDEGAETE